MASSCTRKWNVTPAEAGTHVTAPHMPTITKYVSLRGCLPARA
jgi:hypothetical protein